jgi:hypothetical protein
VEFRKKKEEGHPYDVLNGWTTDLRNERAKQKQHG